MNVRTLPILLLFYTVISFTASLFAQTTPNDPNFRRRVYWLHDINEDNIDATLTNPRSNFWLNYAGIARTPEDNCPDQGPGYFRSEYKMEPSLLSYYTDRPIPKGLYSVVTNSGISLIRQKVGDAPPALDVASRLRDEMNTINSSGAVSIQSPPFVIAHGAGATLALDINRRFPTTEFGGIISIGGANQGIPLINSVSNGGFDNFDKNMKKTFRAGYEKYAAKLESKIFSTIIGLGLGFVGVGEGLLVPDFFYFSLKKLFEKLGLKFFGFVSSEILKGLIKFEGEIIGDLYPELEDTFPPNDPKIFNLYVKSAYSKDKRRLLSDLEPGSAWTQLNATPQNNIPMVSINGRFDKASYFQVMQTARWKAHTKNRCLDLKVNFVVPTLGPGGLDDIIYQQQTVDITRNYENLGAESQQAYSYAFQQEGEKFKSNYIWLSAGMELLKLGQSAAFGGLPGLIAGGVFGGIGMIQAVESGDEIKASFEKGSKWVKNEADWHWAFVIGASKEVTVTASRIAWPNPAIKELPDPLPSGDYPRVDVQITYYVPTLHDGIVPASTQESPQERGWAGGNSPTGLNLEANKVDHFSEANHPVIKERLKATIEARTSQTNPRIRTAFFVEK